MTDINYPDYIDNRTLVAEERAGNTAGYIVGHITSINNPDLLQSLRRMSFLDIVS
jgi:hypothetical protein